MTKYVAYFKNNECSELKDFMIFCIGRNIVATKISEEKYIFEVENDSVVELLNTNHNFVVHKEISNCINNYLNKNYLNANINMSITLPQKNSRTWFTCAEIGSVYNFPPINRTYDRCIGVISFGGALYGTLQSDGTLIDGDVQKYWQQIGISPSNFPRVVVRVLTGATFDVSGNGTDENTLDVEIIGSLFPSSKLTIILFIAPNTNSAMYDVFNTAINGQTTVNQVQYRCNVINCSWGLPEVYAGRSLMTSIDNLFKSAVSRGINIFVSSGDGGSSDGIRGLNLDFPSSSPNAISCGGTSLVCPSLTYSTSSTRETVWNSGGGGVSSFFQSPLYQSGLNKSFRLSPDIAMNADPNTGVLILLNGSFYIFGGTSAVAPYMSAFVSNIGINYFINTKLYYLPNSCFHDIVSGNNGYYNAIVGYDSCSGLGSLNATNAANNLLNFINITSLSTVRTVSIHLSDSPLQLNVTIEPSNATNKQVTWKSSNVTIATVTSSGILSPRKIGSCTISVKTVDGTNIIANITVNVIANIPNRHMIQSTYKKNNKTYILHKAVYNTKKNNNPIIIRNMLNKKITTNIYFHRHTIVKYSKN